MSRTILGKTGKTEIYFFCTLDPYSLPFDIEILITNNRKSQPFPESLRDPKSEATQNFPNSLKRFQCRRDF